jgi:hypothetical protein
MKKGFTGMTKPAANHPWRAGYPPLKEGDILRQIMAYLKANRIYSWRQNTGGVPLGDGKGFRPAATRGVPDIIGILPGGRMLAIEVKSEKGRITPEQESFLDEINRNGGVAFVARSLDHVVSTLREADAWKP